ncbi:fibrinogen-like protein A [Drosophila biarmipes]|uniref:fibrinogen-like protein A n=1 Tax=Drosophila biarmipes TaxID=125945 RepID=UPI0007E78574|nr:fibrinogen-like protein A [Drosophila biarmipes]
MHFAWLPMCLTLWLLQSQISAGAKPVNPQCHSECVELLTPLTDHLRQLQQLSDANAKLKDSANTRELFIKDLDSQLTVAEREMVSKEEVLSAQAGQLKYQAEALQHKADAINKLTKELTEVKAKFDLAGRQLLINDAKTKELAKQLSIQGEQIGDQRELVAKVDALTEKEKKLESRLASALSKIEVQEDVLEQKDGLIKRQNEGIATSEQKINGLSLRIQSVSEELSQVTDDLLKANGTDRCPSGGRGGIYKVRPRGLKHFAVPCNASGWMTIQKRFNGSVDFARSWQEYKNGFGNINGEFFLGLEKIHQMTAAVPHELYIKVGMFFGASSYVHYDNFKIGSEAESYALKSLGASKGPAGDSLSYNLNDAFSTYDRDNDKARGNCAVDHAGGWWYKACCISTLNGKYYGDGIRKDGPQGIQWGTWQNYNYAVSLTASEMMIRPKA